MGDYILKIKSDINEPTNFGVPIRQKVYADTILEGHLSMCL